MPEDGQSRSIERGPYGTNEGDVWLGGGDVQERLDQDGKGLRLIHEMLLRDGKLEECVYVTANPEMIAEAERGTELWVAARARLN